MRYACSYRCRCSEQSEGGEDPAGAGEDARGERAKALHQGVYVGRERQEPPGRRRDERRARV